MCVGYDGKVLIPLWFVHEDLRHHSIGGIANRSGFFAMCVGYDGKV